MAKTKIRKDSHGLYVRTGGYLFRPYHSRTTGFNPSAVDGGNTVFKEGQEVNARHLAGSNTGTVKDNNNKEFWESHGEYAGVHDGNYVQYPSDCIWRPNNQIKNQTQNSRSRKSVEEILGNSIIREIHHIKDIGGKK